MNVIYKENISKEKKEMIEYVIDFTLKVWGVDSSKINLYTVFNFKNEESELNLDENQKNEGAGFLIKYDKNNYGLFLREEVIYNNSDCEEEKYVNFLRILIHEIIHLKQYLSEELYFNSKDEFMWKGKNVDNLNYEDMPHEIEAYEFQDKVLLLFFEEFSVLHEAI
tara:strand:+ start:23613 stop:24110 length:498 start_codon:yes stop_codon:yes gene_type:complete